MITVVLPVHDRCGPLAATLRSIDGQRVHPAHCVVVCDACCGDVEEMVDEWACGRNSRGLSTEVVKGKYGRASAARQAGLEHVTTPWVMFFDSDDVMLPTHVERACRGISDHSTAGIIGWDVWHTDGRGKRGRWKFYRRSMLYHNIMHGGFGTLRYMVRTDVLARAGGWDTTLRSWEDIELGVRLLALHPEVVKLGGEPTVEVMGQPRSVTATISDRDAGGRMETLAAMRRHTASHWVDVKAAILAGVLERRGNPLGQRIAATLTGRVWERLAYWLQRRGVRGVARIIHLLFPGLR